jgi:hypothetical protein
MRLFLLDSFPAISVLSASGEKYEGLKASERCTRLDRLENTRLKSCHILSKAQRWSTYSTHHQEQHPPTVVDTSRS